MKKLFFLLFSIILGALLLFSLASCGECEHEWKAATCTAPKTCAKCGATEGDALGHKWYEATCTSPKSCARCSRTEGSALGHDWTNATCTSPKTCTRCRKTEGSVLGHSWNNATCEKPKTCSRCDKTEGSALGHSWNNATCEKPKTCSRCGKAEGSALGHSWNNATCEKPKTCSHCGKTEGTVSTVHSFSDKWTYDGTYHWHAATCIHTSEVDAKAEHTYNSERLCTTCGFQDVRVAVSVMIDGVKSDVIYTDASSGFRIRQPEKPEDITTNPNSEKYFYGWFVDSNYQTPLFDTTEFRTDAKIYGKWITVYSNRFSYTVSKGEATITKFNGPTSTTVLVIPAYVNGFPVKYIGDKAFQDKTLLRTVILCEGIEVIGKYAFDGCNSMTRIDLPNSLKTISESAFENCSTLPTIVVPNNVTEIGRWAFYNCSGLTSITIPFLGTTKNGTYNTHFGYIFGASSYSSNNTFVPSSLKTVVITDVTSIGNSAFAGCSGLTSITIPDSVTSIGDSAFSECSGLISIEIPNRVTSIGVSAFSGCSRITSIKVKNGNSKYHVTNNCLIETLTRTLIAGCKTSTIPSDGSVTSIGNSAFSGCRGLTNITIPDSVTCIGSSAFSGCTGLTSIAIPNSITSIGYDAFYGCTGLTSITIPFVGATKNGTDTTYFGYIFGASSYSDNKIYVPSALKTVVITGGTSIGNSAFSGCTGLTSITIPNSVTSIGYDAFYGCTGLTSITIPDSVTSIGSAAFSGCTGLKEVHITDLTAWYQISFGSISANPLCHAHNLYLNDSLITDLTIPDSVTSIGSAAFSGCTGLTSITIPDSVTSIGGSAFSGCTGLTSITIPNSVTSIGSSAFSGCTGLTSITIPFVGATKNGTYNTHFGYIFGARYSSENSNYVPTSLKIVVITGETFIDKAAFCYCSGLMSITIPNSVTNIGANAFYDCTGLTSVTIPDSVTSIGSSAFDYCYKLIEVVNHSSLNITPGGSGYGYIGYYAKHIITDEKDSYLTTDENGYIFYDDGSNVYLMGYTGTDTEIVLPETSPKGKMYDIHQYAFYNCTRLTSITISKNVTGIGYRAFYGCSGLTSIAVKTGNQRYHSSGNCLIETKTKALILGCKTSVIPANGSITSIGECAFEGCTGLTSITIPKSVTSIGEYAFYYCTGLISITIPKSVTSIGYYAFEGCTGLKRIYYTGTQSEWENISKSGCYGYYIGDFTIYYNCRSEE